MMHTCHLTLEGELVGAEYLSFCQDQVAMLRFFFFATSNAKCCLIATLLIYLLVNFPLHIAPLVIRMCVGTHFSMANEYPT
jgi:hypothetical protein